MFPNSNQNMNHQYMDFDFSDELDLRPKDDDGDDDIVNIPDPISSSVQQQQQYYCNDNIINNYDIDHDHYNMQGQGSTTATAEYDQIQYQYQTTSIKTSHVVNFAAAVGAWPSTNEPPAPGSSVGEKQKKLVAHKEMERQRRQEMSQLHSALRGLLPLEYIKGKRSIADHMSEAVTYIGHLQDRIKELKHKKDTINNMVLMNQTAGSAAGSSSSSSSSSRMSRVMISVNPCHNGVQVLISSDQSTGGDQLLLSKVMEVLGEEGHDILSCVSNLVNHKLFHTIQTQVINHPNSEIDLLTLQQKLSYVINYSNSSS